jgi:hypothetical protein
MSEYEPSRVVSGLPFTASGRLHNLYRSGDEEGTAPDSGEAFSGLARFPRKVGRRLGAHDPLPGGENLGPDAARVISQPSPPSVTRERNDDGQAGQRS